MADDQQIVFAPHLTLKNVLAGIEFYEKAFGAIELRKWSNQDGSVHVAEMAIEGTSIIGIFVPDPYAFVRRGVMAGGKESSPVQDYEYGYRQGTLIDPFGHHWLVEKKI